MATLAAGAATLLDHAKRMDPDGKIAAIAELLSQRNEILADMMFKEGNLATGHRITVRTGLPTVAWRLLNAGVAPSKSTTAQIDEACGMLEAWCEVDKDLAMLNGNTPQFRLSENLAFVEAMSQEFAQTLFYGNSSTSPEEFTGLSARYSSLSAGNAQNVISAAGSQSDNTSIWLVCWGDNIHGIFPKGSQAGLVHEDIGEVTVEVSAGIAGNRMRAFQDRWQWKGGLAVRDWRYAVRIPNIDVGNLVGKSSNADIIELMIKAYHHIPNIRMGSPAFYMNRTVFEMLDILRRDDVVTGAGLRFENVDGMVQSSFRGVPIRVCDQLLNTETVVS